MKNNQFNLNGTITIYYNSQILMAPIHYQLLNAILTDSMLHHITEGLGISKQKAIGLINHMNRLAPYPVIEIEKIKHELHYQITDFGMRLVNSYAQKEFDLYMFLKKSDSHLNNSFMNSNEEKHAMAGNLSAY